MIGRLFLLACGQVRVRITGASLPKFLNICAQHEIVLRHMERTDWNEMYATMSVAAFRDLRRYMGRTGCRIHIVRRRGAPFVVAQLRPRYGLWGGFFVLLFLCWVLSAHIWSIETNISPGLPEQEIMQQLDALGVHIGARRRAIKTGVIRWSMMMQQPNMTFFSLNIEGNRLTVEAYGDPPPQVPFDQDAVTKIVATRAGVVHELLVQEGQPMVRAGDAVAVGDTLISGLVAPTREEGDYHLTHARGRVEAYTAYHTRTARALTKEEKQYTGKVKHQYALVLGNKRLNLYFGSGISDRTCDKIVETKKLWLSDSVVFPVSLVKQTYVFYKTQAVTQTADDVRVDMISYELGRIAAGMDGRVLTHTESVTEENGAAVLQMSVDAVEQIGTEAVDDSVIPEKAPPEKEQP